MFTRWWMGDSKFLRRRAQLIILAIAIISLSALSGCSLLPEEDVEEVLPTITPPKLSEKPTYLVKLETIEKKVQGVGKLMSMQEEMLFFTASGSAAATSLRVKEIFAQAGDFVNAGDLLVELDVTDKIRELRRAKLEFRKDELNMIEILRQAEKYEPDQLEQYKIDFELKKTALTEMEEMIESARLTAPFSGNVVSIYVKRGDTVQPYAPVVMVSNLEQLTVAAKFSAESLRDISLGMEAIVNINSAGSHQGIVDQLPIKLDNNQNNGNPSAQPSDTIDQYVVVQLDKWPEGGTRGTPLSVSVITNRKVDALVIPPVALRIYNGRNYVQVVDNQGNKSEVDVEVGMQTSTQVEIVRGLVVGQKVVGR